MRIFVVAVIGLMMGLGSLATHASRAHAEDAPGTARIAAVNLDSEAAADDYAKELIQNYRASVPAGISPEQRPEIVLVHLGSAPPSQLKWVLLHLDAAKIPYRLRLMTSEELEQSLQEAQEKAERLVLVQAQAPREGVENVRSVREKASLFVRQLFGLPNGMTLWYFDVPSLGLKRPTFPRSEEEKRWEKKNASVQASVAAVSLSASYLGVTFFLNGNVNVDPGFIAGLPVFFSWVWIWVYQGRPFATVMAEGKSLKEVEPGFWERRNSDLHFYSHSYFRGLLTNAIVLTMVTNGDIFHWHMLGVAMTNAGVNLFARSWVDKIFTDKQAERLADGTDKVGKGQHTREQTIRYRFYWELAYGILKNLQLLGAGKVLDGIYLMMGMVGIGTKLHDERHALNRILEGALPEGLKRSGMKTEDPNYTPGATAMELLCEGAFL